MRDRNSGSREDEGLLRDPEAYAVKVRHVLSCHNQAVRLPFVLNYALLISHQVHLAHTLPTSATASLVHARFVLGADGARSWTRKALGLVLEGEQTDLYWGVIDFVPETNFPDVRNFCALHTHHGSLMLIPREADMVSTRAREEQVVEGAVGRGRHR